MNITITEVQDAIKLALKNKFPKITVDSYDPSGDLSKLAPACLLDVEELPKAPDIGDGRYSVNARISIHCILGFEEKNLQTELQEFAIAVSQFVYEYGIWLPGSVVTKPKDIDAYPGNFKTTTSGGYDSWVVSWQQNLYLGASKWAPPETRGGISVATNSENEDQASEYQSLEASNAPAD